MDENMVMNEDTTMENTSSVLIEDSAADEKQMQSQGMIDQAVEGVAENVNAVEEGITGDVDTPVENIDTTMDGAVENVDTTVDGAEGTMDSGMEGSTDGTADSTDGMDMTGVDGTGMDMMGVDGVGMDEMGSMIGDPSGMGVPKEKAPLLSSWTFILGVTAGVVVLGIIFGLLLGKRRIKKGIELYEN